MNLFGLSFILYIFSVQVKSGACYNTVSGGEFRIKKRNLTLILNLILPSIVFHNQICVFFMIFTALSFLRLIHGLLFIRGGNVS